MDFQFCQSVLIKNLPESLVSLYNDLQEDYKKMLPFLIRNSGLGYYLWHEDDTFTIVEAGERTISPSLAKLIEIMGKGGTKATNLYGVVYTKHKPNTKIRKDCKAGVFLSKCDSMSEELATAKIKELCETTTIQKEEWETFRSRILNGESFNTVWQEVMPRLDLNEGVRLACEIKQSGCFPKAKRNEDYSYCTALFDMLVSAFNGWVKANKEHQTKRENLTITLEEKKKNSPKTYEILLELSNTLDKMNYGLSKRVLRGCLDIRSGKRNNQGYFALPYEEFSKHSHLMEATEKDIYTAYSALKTYWKLNQMQKYISMPRFKSDYQVPFGLTGKNVSFELECNDDVICATMDGHKPFYCQRSHYFNSLTVKKEMNRFAIRFRHRVKSKKFNKSGNWIEATVKEVKLQKRDGNFYLYLPFAITHEDNNFNIEKFFMKSDPDKKILDSLPDSIVCTAFDMNVGTPLTKATCVLHKGVRGGKIDALDYGSGELISEPQIACHDTKLSGKILALQQKMNKLKNAIKEYKASVRNNTALEDKTLEWLTDESRITHNSVRLKIQTIMSRQFKQYRELKHQCRLNGHNYASENIRLLQLMDMAHSLETMYNNIHLCQGQRTKRFVFARNDVKRANFREFVTKKYASEVVKHAAGSNVVFIEDIDLEFDSDNDGNSMARLFAAGQLKKYIQNALHKAGIGCVFVNPALTSRTDPVTGMLGYRPKWKEGKPPKRGNKEDLFVKRDGAIGQLHSDIAAALNVLLVGVNHSVFPRRIWVSNGSIAKKELKRLNRFNKERNLDGTYFRQDSTTIVVEKEKPKGDLLTSWLYVTPEGFMTEQQKIDHENAIKDLVESAREIEEFSLTPESVSTYKAFRVKPLLDPQ